MWVIRSLAKVKESLEQAKHNSQIAEERFASSNEEPRINSLVQPQQSLCLRVLDKQLFKATPLLFRKEVAFKNTTIWIEYKLESFLVKSFWFLFNCPDSFQV